jgi:Rhomboid family
MKSLVMFAGYNLLFGLVPGIDNSAHIGGLLSGAALGAFFAGHLTAAPEERQHWRTYALVGTSAIIVVAFEVLKKLYALPGK